MDHEQIQRVARFYDCFRYAYPLIEPFLVRARQRLVDAVNEEPPGELLEVGVGKGTHLGAYRARRITGVDVSSGMIRTAASNARRPGIELKVVDGEHLEFADATFDHVVLAFVLSVTAHPERMLAEAWRVLRPGGYAYVLNHETSARTWWPVSFMRQLLRLHSRFTLKDIPGWPAASEVRREACPPLGWSTFVVLRK